MRCSLQTLSGIAKMDGLLAPKASRIVTIAYNSSTLLQGPFKLQTCVGLSLARLERLGLT
jgi:hypothetical protein